MRGRVALLVGGDDGVAAALGAAGFHVVTGAGDGDEPVDAVVVVGPDRPRPGPLVEVDDATWDELWEQPMGDAIAVLAAARRRLRPGGRVVVVTPALAQTGAAGLAGFAAAVEGRRLLALSAAQQWAPDGISVNCVAPAAGADPGPAVAFLASEASLGISGVTLPVPGGPA